MTRCAFSVERNRRLEILPEEIEGGDAARLAEHAPFLRREAGRLARGPGAGGDGGSDLAQEAWVAALEAVRRGKGPRPEPRARAVWLRKVVRNKAAEVFRRAGAARRGGRATIVPLEAEPIDGGTSPSGEARRAERDGRLGRALRSLDDRDRRVLNLTLVEGKSGPEVAALLGVSDGFARRLRREALGRLRAAYEALGGAADFS